MCSHPPAKLPLGSGRRAAAFTLLEVMISVVIITFLIFTVSRFVRANLSAIRLATDYQVTEQESAGLLAYLRAQMEELPTRTPGALLGTPRKFNNMAADELQWMCPAGLGVLTTAGSKMYFATLAIQPVQRGAKELEIGLRRWDTTEEERTYKWLPLMRPAAGLELRYYDSRQNAWLDRWADQGRRPALVKVKLWRRADQEPLETIIPVPSARSQGVVQ